MNQPVTDPQVAALAIELGGAGSEAKFEGEGALRTLVLTLPTQRDTFGLCRAWGEKQKLLALPQLQIRFKRTQS